MGTAKTLFLAKRGCVFGPFAEADLAKMRLNGEINQYTYLWEEGSRRWVNLEPPPAELSANSLRQSDRRWEAVGVSRTSSLMISGTIQNVGPQGCDLVVGQTTDCPPLSAADALRLNVLDPGKNVAVNVEAKIKSISRQDHSWIFHLHWPIAPEL